MESWGHPLTIAMLAASALLLAAFVAIESRVAHPLLPLRVVRDRTRGGAYLGLGLAASAMFAVFLFLTYYLQRTKGFTPIETGLAFLPMTAAIIATATAVNVVLLRRFGPRPLLTAGMTLGAAGMVGFAQLDDGLELRRARAAGARRDRARPRRRVRVGVLHRDLRRRARDAGVASAMVNTMQQVGGSLGDRGAELDLRPRDERPTRPASARRPSCSAQAAVHGYTVAFWVAAGIFAVGAVLVAALIRPCGSARRSPSWSRRSPGVASHS